MMPDHIHLIARMGHDASCLGQWIKALKAVVFEGKPVTYPDTMVRLTYSSR